MNPRYLKIGSSLTCHTSYTLKIAVVILDTSSQRSMYKCQGRSALYIVIRQSGRIQTVTVLPVIEDERAWELSYRLRGTLEFHELLSQRQDRTSAVNHSTTSSRGILIIQ